MEKPGTPLRAGIYGRESKGKTKSVADQLAACDAAVREQGWTVAGRWNDTSSASSAARKVRTDWPAVRAAIVAGHLDALVLWEASRGARVMSEWLALVDDCGQHRVRIHIVTDDRTFDPWRSGDRKSLLYSGVDAEHETNRLGDRVRRGTATAAEAGGFHGRIPYGYTRVTVGERRSDRGDLRPLREQHPDRDTAPIVVELFARVAANEPVNRIIRDLGDRGVPSPKAGRWTHESVLHVVRNPAYIGLRRHRPRAGGGEQLYPTTAWAPLVDEVTWRAANAILDRPDRKSNSPGGYRHLLTVIATAPCGGELEAGKEPTGVQRYRCRKDACVSIVEDVADEYVTRVVCARLSQPDAAGMWQPDTTEQSDARVELARLEADLDEALQAFVAGTISAKAYGMKEAALTPQIEDARRRSRPADVPLSVLELTDATDVRAAWDRLELPAQRDVLRLVFDRIVVGPGRHGGVNRWSTPEQRLGAAAERINVKFRTT